MEYHERDGELEISNLGLGKQVVAFFLVEDLGVGVRLGF